MARPIDDQGFKTFNVFEGEFDLFGLRVFYDFWNGALGDFRQAFEGVLGENDESVKGEGDDAEK